MIVAVHYGFGRHSDVNPSDATFRWHQAFYAGEFCYAPSIALTKLSILFFYARVFPLREFIRYLYAVGALVICWWIAFQGVTTFECSPIHFLWTETPSTGHCIDFLKSFIAMAIPNIATDLVLLALPLPQIWKINLPLTQKLGLIVIFSLGGL